MTLNNFKIHRRNSDRERISNETIIEYQLKELVKTITGFELDDAKEKQVTSNAVYFRQDMFDDTLRKMEEGENTPKH